MTKAAEEKIIQNTNVKSSGMNFALVCSKIQKTIAVLAYNFKVFKKDKCKI